MYTAHYWAVWETEPRITDQLWFELVFAVSMTQPSVATLAPGEELSTGSDAGAVCPSCCDIHHFHSPERLDYTRTVTGTKVDTSHSYYRNTLSASLILTVTWICIDILWVIYWKLWVKSVIFDLVSTFCFHGQVFHPRPLPTSRLLPRRTALGSASLQSLQPLSWWRRVGWTPVEWGWTQTLCLQYPICLQLHIPLHTADDQDNICYNILHFPGSNHIDIFDQYFWVNERMC